MNTPVNLIFPCIFWKRLPPVFLPRKKYHAFGKKVPSFQIMQERLCPSAIPFEKTIFSEHLKKISYFRVFFEKDHPSFSVWGKIIFSGKRNIIFPDDTKKFTFQRELFGKTIFSGRLEKEIRFSVQRTSH